MQKFPSLEYSHQTWQKRQMLSFFKSDIESYPMHSLNLFARFKTHSLDDAMHTSRLHVIYHILQLMNYKGRL